VSAWAFAPFETLYAEPSRNGVYKSSEHHGNGAKIVNMGELFAHEFIGAQEMSRLAMTTPELEKSGLLDGDLLFGRRSLVEAGAGKCSLVDQVSEPTTFESSIIRVRLAPEEVEPRFYYYWFRSPAGRGSIRAIVSGTNVKGIRSSDLKSVQVPVIKKETQCRIVGLLRAYDDFIENNRRRIQLLEQSARLFYREWFVHLRFPGHEHFRIVDGVPEGWEKKPVSEVAEVNARSMPNNHEGDIEYIDIASVRTGAINQTTAYAFADAPGRARRIVRHGDMIWSCVRPNRASYACIWNPKPSLIVSTGFCVLSPKTVPPTFLYYALSTQDFIGHLTTNAKGATYPAVVSSDFASYEILVPKPSSALLEEFRANTETSFEMIELLRQQNRKLREARDLLLPRLMSGEITV
jgi:type I restriction enzyme S subunit